MRNFILFVFSFFLCEGLWAQYYVGGGLDYNIPAGEIENSVSAGSGFNIQFENRSTCWLWFGLHANYFSTEPPEEYPKSLAYYESALSISPTVRFNYLSLDCDSYDWVPYVKGQVNLSIANNTDELDKFGMGTSFGTGIAYSFNAFQQCWMIDAGIDWYSPNNIIIEEGRIPLFLYRSNVSLTWRL